MGKIRLIIVEDSLFFRDLLVTNLVGNPDIEIVAIAKDPIEAMDKILEYKPDVMTLDIELPKMNGLDFLKKLMPKHPIRTIVVSTLSDKVFEAMRAGAVDFVAKPTTSDPKKIQDFVKNELPTKIKVAASASLKVPVPTAELWNKQNEPEVFEKKPVESEVRSRLGRVSFDLKPKKNTIIAIGASTGGTEATTTVLKTMGSDLPGIVVTQHMPAGFTKMYAERLDGKAGLKVRVKEAESGDMVLPGHVYIAPGGEQQMKIVKANGGYQIVLYKSEKVSGHCPSVDVLFQSVAEAAGRNAVGIILTGMGADGAKGLLAMRQAGARTIGQDQQSCVVYGMPKVAYELGAVEYQEDIHDITQRTYSIVKTMNEKTAIGMT